MLKMTSFRLVLSASIFVFCIIGGCVSKQKAPQRAVSQETVYAELVLPELLDTDKLEIVWQNKLPIREEETLERLFIIGNRIYALSDHNYMVSLNRENGNVIFSTAVGEASLPVVGLELYGDGLFSLIGNELVVINPEFGTKRSAERLEFNAVCPAVRNDSYFYIAGDDKRVHTLRAKDRVKIFEVSAENDSDIVSVIADGDFIVFATDTGNCISINADEPRRRWHFNAADSIVGPIVRDGRELFFASKDTNIYKLDILNGRFIWKYQAGAMLERSPRVTGKIVYQYAHNKGLAAIDKESGRGLWEVWDGLDLLAEANGKAYVITKTGEIAAIDNDNARELYRVNFVGVSKHATNVVDSKIYISDIFGRIACLKPAE